MPPSIIERYQNDLARPGFVQDPVQARVVERFHALQKRLAGRRRASLFRRSRAVPGLYLWGDVGRGKTYLMDLFYETLPVTDKQREHFHRFMERVHDALRERRGERDPLTAFARSYAREVRVLCLDEFFVSDIADAMILAGLLEQLFSRGVTLVATSNCAPQQLYRDGLQRAKFEPAIDLLETHCEVFELAGDTDYRLRILDRAAIYHVQPQPDSRTVLKAHLDALVPGEVEWDRTLSVNHRPLPAVAMADGVAWFTFGALCCTPRSAADYIELARRFNTVLLSDIPQLGVDDENAARRFIHLIDELYDRRVKLIATAAATPDALYRGRKLEFEFRRTQSRLMEMQQRDYLRLAHRP